MPVEKSIPNFHFFSVILTQDILYEIYNFLLVKGEVLVKLCSCTDSIKTSL